MIVDKDNPPPLRAVVSAVCWERSPDPFHADAFKGVDLPENAVIITLGGELNNTPVRRQGWMGIDWCGNPVGWIHDGAEVDGDPGRYEIKDGPYGKEWHPVKVA